MPRSAPATSLKVPLLIARCAVVPPMSHRARTPPHCCSIMSQKVLKQVGIAGVSDDPCALEWRDLQQRYSTVAAVAEILPSAESAAIIEAAMAEVRMTPSHHRLLHITSLPVVRRWYAWCDAGALTLVLCS